ncbi:hypothetical protein NG798_24275 [Ancylothrix sp. C2]|nr:hypothetical protein [Ancylothrix sp. D3o]
MNEKKAGVSRYRHLRSTPARYRIPHTKLDLGKSRFTIGTHPCFRRQIQTTGLS